MDKLIRIFENIPEASLYLAGKIEDDVAVMNSAKIKYLGFLNSIELEKEIRNAAFIVSTSRLPETFGLIALEGMKAGRPFVGYNTGAYGEVVIDNKTGYLCDSEEELMEKIKKLATDEGLRILFSRNSLEQANKYDPDKYYLEILDIFKTFAEKSKENSPLDFLRSIC